MIITIKSEALSYRKGVCAIGYPKTEHKKETSDDLFYRGGAAIDVIRWHTGAIDTGDRGDRRV